MRQRTIKEAFQSKEGISPEAYHLYIIREGPLVLYVGQSRHNTTNRLYEHLGRGSRGRMTLSSIGQCILSNLPGSGSWIFEEYTLEDCREITLIARKASSLYQAFPHIIDNPLDLSEVEEALIKHHRPCFNSACNPNPTPLPEHLQGSLAYYENPYAAKLEDEFGI